MISQAEEILTRHYLEKFSYNPDCLKSHQEFKQIAINAINEALETKKEEDDGHSKA